jgi:hypothetical protein
MSHDPLSPITFKRQKTPPNLFRLGGVVMWRRRWLCIKPTLLCVKQRVALAQGMP